jgi:hypothetical protein
VFRGESYGWELRVEDDEQMIYGHRFPVKADALTLAAELREELEGEGWREPGQPAV